MNHWKFIHQEMIRISNLENEQEREYLNKKLDMIIDKVNDCDSAVWNFKKELLLKNMNSRGIIFENSDVSAGELRRKWEHHFAGGLSSEEKKAIFIEDYLWHIFSYQRVRAIEKSDARKAFNRKKKKSVYVFYQNEDSSYYIEHAENL